MAPPNTKDDAKDGAIGRLFGLFSRKPEKVTRRRRNADDDDNDITETPLSLEDMLKSMSGRFSKVHLITFADFRHALADRWNTLGEKVMMIAEGTVRRHLDKGDFFNRHGEDAFLMVFAKLNEMEGRARAARIADELGRRLVGAQFKGLENAAIRTAEVAAEALLTEDGGLDLNRLEEAVASATPHGEPTAKAGKPQNKPADPAGVQEPISPKLSTRDRLKQKDEPRLVALDHKKRVTEAHLVTMESKKQKAAGSDPQWQSMKIARAPLPALLADAQFLFFPTWSSRTESVDTHFIQPCRTAADGTPLVGQRVLPPDPDDALRLALDQEILARAAEALMGMSSSNRTTVVAPVHWRTLQERQRDHLTSVLTGANEAIRLIGLVIEVVGLPADALPSDIMEVRHWTAGQASDVLVRLPLDEPRVDQVCHAGFGGVSLHLFDPPARVLERMTEYLYTFHALAGTTPLNLWGTRRRDDIMVAVENDFARVNGPALKKAADQPGAPMPLKRGPFLKLLEKARREKEEEKR
ncbi:MAG: hypothetical protein ACPGNT_01130, partial [Rhodospirillales bacterium]